ncbi:protein toll-like [Galendromus occidentalis]|uniref:Protein toll-like n=1 Tax=Galendromus occidentalis TaxID=34638 RepID=A0AAJ6QRU8_9ACAR|nr:protein toll-like [Galendromus occidentalis]
MNWTHFEKSVVPSTLIIRGLPRVQVRTLSRPAREVPVREIEYIGKNREIRQFTIEYAPNAKPNGMSSLEISCGAGAAEIPKLLEKLKSLNVNDVGDVKFKRCPLPRNLTYGQILDGSDRTVTIFSLISPILDSSVIPKKPFEGFASSIRELSIMETNSSGSKALESFEEGFFEPFGNLTFLSLVRNRINSTVALQPIPHLKELNLSENPLKNLSAGTFQNLTELRWLVLVGCRIESIDRNAFATLGDLKLIDLFKNSLTELPSDLFKNTLQLGEISLSLNDFRNGLPENIFRNLGRLENFTCWRCGLQSLHAGVFRGATRLYRLDLGQNEISILDNDTFRENPRLQFLSLSNNRLSDLEGLNLPPQLKTLELQSNQLSTLPKDLFELAPSLVSINLGRNAIHHLKPGTFSILSQLRALDLSQNLLTNFSSSHSTQWVEIRDVNLNHNRLTTMPNIQSHNIVHFEKFSMRHNKIRFARMLPFRSPKLDIDLRDNPLETVDVSYLMDNFSAGDESPKPRIQYMIDGPLKCDCHLLRFYQYIKNKTIEFGSFPEKLLQCRGQTEPFLSMTEEDFRCKLNETEGCPQPCDCDIAEIDRSVRVDCSGRNLTTLPPLPEKTTELDLSNNHFEEVPAFPETSRLREIDLSNNHIHDISNLVARHGEGWTDVSLANNSIRYIGSLRKENYRVDFSGNLFVCTCDTWTALQNYFKDVEVKERRRVACDELVNQTYLSMNDFLNDSSCDPIIENQKAVNRLTVILVCSAALLIVLITIVYYKNRRRIIVYMFTHHYNIYVLIWPDSEVDCEKTYDAFVSFSDQDINVVHEIIKELEKIDPSSGEPTYKLCLHYRDWIPGNSIVYNIVNSVQNSRRTVLVLSENFISSVWLNVEFRAALTQMIEDRSHKLIIVVIGELPSEKKLDKELQDLLQNTYLKWGNPGFWDHIRFLLPHKNQKSKGIDKTKSVLNGHPMTRILLESRPTSANLARTAETLENEKNRLKSIAQPVGGTLDSANGHINDAYVAVSTEDISVHCDSFKNEDKPKVTSGRHCPRSANAVRPPRKRDKVDSDA